MNPGSFNSKAQELWDFVRCQRPDGTFYGSPSARCVKGQEAGEKEEDVNTKYERLMEEAKAKFKEADRAMARNDREESARIRAEARALSTEAIELKYFSGKSSPPPVKPASPKEEPAPKKETPPPAKPASPKKEPAPKETQEDKKAKYDRLMEEAKAKFKDADRAKAKGDEEESARIRAEGRALSKEALDLMFGPKKNTPSPVKPVTPDNPPVPPKAKAEEKPKSSGMDGEKVLRNYILGGSMETGSMLETNMKLRGVSKTKITSEEQEQVKAMDRMLDRLPRNSGETHYRGFYLDPEKDKAFIETLKKGGTIRDNGFSSYSRDRDQAEQFADQGIGRPYIIVSRSPELRDVRRYAPEDYEDQQESIMPRGTPLRILKTETQDGITYLYTG